MKQTKIFGAFASKRDAETKAKQKGASVKTITVRGKTRYAVVKKP